MGWRSKVSHTLVKPWIAALLDEAERVFGAPGGGDRYVAMAAWIDGLPLTAAERRAVRQEIANAL